jgi:hypothetical protein
MKGLEIAIAIEHQYASYTPGARNYVLEQARIWMENRGSDVPQILLLEDNPGTGKSVMAKHLLGEWRSQGKLAGWFFFSAEAIDASTTKVFFSTIAQRGLWRLGPTVRHSISESIRNLRDPISAPIEEQ